MEPKDFEVTSPPTDGISAMSFSPAADYLACTSWDQQLRVWEVQQNGNTVPKCSVAFDAPALCCAWSQDGTKLFGGGASKSGGRLLDLNTGQTVNFGQHEAPISCAAFCDAANMQNILVTGSWDKTLKYWDMRSPNPLQVIPLPERCYSLQALSPVMVVSTAERHLLMYDLQKPAQVYKQIVSPLKYQTRCISVFTTKTGFAIGSIEGRVAIHHFEDKDSGLNFSFKCHREGSNVYSVNAISFHPTYGTFSTAGSDGTFSFWDKDCKQRLKVFNNVGAPIAATCFNRDGRIFAYAASYDWSKGHEGHRQDAKDRIFLHAVQEADIKPRAVTKKR